MKGFSKTCDADEIRYTFLLYTLKSYFNKFSSNRYRSPGLQIYIYVGSIVLTIGSRGRRILVGFTTTFAISVYHQQR